MERLTERDKFGNADIIGVESTALYSSLEFEEENLVTNALNKLAEYEEAEENGRPTFIFPEDAEKIVYGIHRKINGDLQVCMDYLDDCDLKDFGKTVFPTREEAEKTKYILEQGVNR